MPVTVLRLGHRRERDARISTHCGLVARAFGAREIIYAGEKDDKMMASVRDVAKRWGGPFAVRYTEKPLHVIKKFHGLKAHLTMYGIPFEKKLRAIKKRRNVLIIIGSEKVPPEIYRLVDLNLSVTSQPHSEVAALAVVLSKLCGPKKFRGAKLLIVPQNRGKSIKNRKKI